MFKAITKKLADRRKLSGWQTHINVKFRRYEHLWAEAYQSWQDALVRGDREAMLDCLGREALYLRAEQLAHQDMNLPILRRLARWDVDYLAEARRLLWLSQMTGRRL